jgi:hypothetical protein
VYAELEAMGLVSGETGAALLCEKSALAMGHGIDQQAIAADVRILILIHPSLPGQGDRLEAAGWPTLGILNRTCVISPTRAIGREKLLPTTSILTATARAENVLIATAPAWAGRWSWVAVPATWWPSMP